MWIKKHSFTGFLPTSYLWWNWRVYHRAKQKLYLIHFSADYVKPTYAHQGLKIVTKNYRWSSSDMLVNHSTQVLAYEIMRFDTVYSRSNAFDLKLDWTDWYRLIGLDIQNLAKIVYINSNQSIFRLKRSSQHMCVAIRDLLHKLSQIVSTNFRGSGCGSVGRAVASDTRGLRFKSSH